MTELTTKRKPTQADVARRAAVSQAMVSYVLNDHPAVSVPTETRRRILEAVEELGYVPNSAARSLRTRKTMTLAAIIPDITNPYYPAFIRGIQDAAETEGYDVISYNTDGDHAKELKALRSIQHGRVDGAILVLFHVVPEDLRPLAEAGLALLKSGPNQPSWIEVGVDNLMADNVEAARTAVNYLIERGHTRIGMVAGVAGTPPRERRVIGYSQALAEHHIPLDEILIRAGDFTESGGYEGMQELLKLSPRPTAVFAANDLMAIGAMFALREAGISIPDDMAIVGFDDIPAARLVQPPLTTVAQYPEALGRRSAEMVFERLKGEAPVMGRFEAWQCDLVIRESA
jgi:LacI family transcriptional regulator